MPSTTTTNVTIGTILDLIGPTTQSGADCDASTGFDSLLQAAPSAASPPPTPTTRETHAAAASESRPADCKQKSATPSRGDDEQSATNPDHDSSPSQSATGTSSRSAAEKHENPSSEGSADSTPDSDEADEQIATEQIIAQSLAGLPAAPKNLPAEAVVQNNEVAASEQKTTGNAEAANGAQPTSFASQVKATTSQPRIAAVAPAAQTSGETEEQPQKLPEVRLKAVTAAVVAAASAGKETISQPRAGDNVSAIPKDEHDQPSGDELHQTADIKLSSNEEPQPQQAKQDQAQTTSSLSLTLDASALVAPSGDGSTSQAAMTAPLVVAVSNAPSSAGQSGAPQSSNPAAAATSISATPRSRLPAQALAPGPSAGARRGPIEIDSARLISRVVRAFSAAQERDGEVHLRLSPPELGSLRLDVRVENGALTAHLQAETDSARLAIIDNLPTLRDRLAEQGIRIERFDVDLMQRQPGGMPDQTGGRQSETPEAPPRLGPSATNSGASTPPTALSSPALASGSGGLNVIV